MTNWDRVARAYGPFMWPLEVLVLRRWRKRAVAAIPANARLLEVGSGPGMNFRFFSGTTRAVVSDSSMAMARLAARRAPARVSIVVADAERLPFRDEAFDASLATLAFCNIPDDRKGMRELRRVVGGGGTSVFLEHVRPESRTGAFLADSLERLTGHFGEHVNRRTAANVADAGFEITRLESAAGAPLRLIVARR